MISVVVPYHDMANGAFFLKRCIDSITSQTYKDYEIVLVKEGKMAENTNAGIRKARGNIIKILYMDDYFSSEFALEDIAHHFKGGWLVTGCEHDNGVERGSPHLARWSEDIKRGINTIGSPSVVAFQNADAFHSPLRIDSNVYFDENLTWVLDCDLYARLYERYGEPTIMDSYNVVIGIGEHQTTNLLPNELKQKEVEYLINKI